MFWKKYISGISTVLFVHIDDHKISVEETFTEMWKFMISDILPLNHDVEWDYIKLELWIDSGRVILYPTSSKSKFRIERAVCSVFFPSLLEQSEMLNTECFGSEQTEDLPDIEIQEVFEQAVTKLELEWIHKAELAVQQIPEVSKLRLAFYSTDDDLPLHSIII